MVETFSGLCKTFSGQEPKYDVDNGNSASQELDEGAVRHMLK